MDLAENAALAKLAVPGALLLASAVALTGWIERRSWALAFDLARQTALVGATYAYFAASTDRYALAATGGAIAILAILFGVLRPDREELSRVA
jgi:hypothetical protein